LLDLAERSADGEGPVTVPLTQDDLAGLTGATRKTANEVLGELEGRGLVRAGRGRVTV
jgi:CRP-like cAMP-binding protein